MKYWLFVAFLCLSACTGKNSGSVPEAAPVKDDLPEGFAEFYQRFHSDSLYQVEHIVFPLKGLPNQADSAMIASGNFYWQAEDWKIQKAIDFEMSEYKRELLPLNKMMVEEHIIHQNGKFGMVRRFARLGDDWQLIYYAGMNRFAGH